MSPGEQTPGNLTGPRTSAERVIIGSDPTSGRDGDPNSRARTSFNCGDDDGGARCSIKFSSAHSGLRDGESLTVTFTMANQPPVTLTFGTQPPNQPYAQQFVTLEGCGDVTVEVKANAGTNARSIESGFSFVLEARKCHNCPPS